jgi:anti-anti-sigma factor
VEPEGDGHVLRLCGDVDGPVVSEAQSSKILDQVHIVAVDVGELRYIDSAGLSLLVQWAKTARREGRPARIRRVQPRFQRVVEVAGLTAVFDMTDGG